MAPTTKRAPVCCLSSEYSGAPGLSWTARIDFHHSRRTVRARIRCDGIEQEKSFSDRPSTWRAIAAFLADNVDGWGTPWGAGVSAGAPTFLPYQVDVILLCWLRYEDEARSRWGNVALSLPDAWLEEACGRYRDLTANLHILEAIRYSLEWGERLEEEENDDDDEYEDEQEGAVKRGRHSNGDLPAVEELGATASPSWEHDLCLLELAIGEEKLPVLELARTLGTHESSQPYADTTAVLRERNLSFASIAGETAAQVATLLPPPHSWIESMGQSTRIRTRITRCHRKFLLTGSLSESDVRAML